MNKAISVILGVLLTLFSCKAGENETKASQNTNTENKTNIKPVELTKAAFLEKVANYETNPDEFKYLGDKPAIIDFYATWCGPCKMVAPILEELASEYGEDIYIYKIDTDRERELSAVFGIQSIPTLLFIPLEGRPQMAQGAMPKAGFVQVINEVLLKKDKE